MYYKKPTKKAISYIKTMISKEIWKVSTKIPTISTIATKLNISSWSVRRAIRELEYKKLIINHDSLGFFVYSKSQNSLYSLNRQNYLLNNITTQLTIAQLLNNNGIIFKNFILQYEPNNLIVFNTILNVQKNYTLNDIINLFSNPMQLKHVMDTNKLIMLKKKQQWKKEQSLYEVAPALLIYRKKLGIPWIKN